MPTNLDTRTIKTERASALSVLIFLWRDSKIKMQHPGGVLLGPGWTGPTPSFASIPGCECKRVRSQNTKKSHPLGFALRTIKKQQLEFSVLLDRCDPLSSTVSLRGGFCRRGNLPVQTNETTLVKIEVPANNVQYFEYFCFPTLYQEIATSLRSSQ